MCQKNGRAKVLFPGLVSLPRLVDIRANSWRLSLDTRGPFSWAAGICFGACGGGWVGVGPSWRFGVSRVPSLRPSWSFLGVRLGVEGSLAVGGEAPALMGEELYI